MTIDEDDWQKDRIAAWGKTVEFWHEENARMRAVAKVAILFSILTFIICGTVIWARMGACG